MYLSKNGKAPNGFQGPQPKDTVCELLNRALPHPAEMQVQKATPLVQARDFAVALSLLKALCQEPKSAREAGLLLAEIFLQLNHPDHVQAVLDQSPCRYKETCYQSLLAQIQLLRQAADTPEI